MSVEAVIVRGGEGWKLRVAAGIGVLAWVVDDTGIAKDGRHSPGVKRQYSGTLGKIGNCQVAVSVHAVGERGTLPLGWSLYLPEEWCADRERREKAKTPECVVFQTKPALVAVSCGRRVCRRSTESSCRSTTLSSSLKSCERGRSDTIWSKQVTPGSRATKTRTNSSRSARRAHDSTADTRVPDAEPS